MIYCMVEWYDADTEDEQYGLAIAHVGLLKMNEIMATRHDGRYTAVCVEGSLLSIPIDRFFAGDLTMEVLFEPSASESLEEDRGTKNFLVLSILDAGAMDCC